MNDLQQLLLANVESAQSSYRSGYEEGRRVGFNEGLAEARKIFDAAFPKTGGRDQHQPIPVLLRAPDEDEGYDPPEQPEDFDEYEAACDDAGINPYGEL